MSPPASPVPPVPTFLSEGIKALLQKGLTTAAATLVTYGVINSDQTAGLVSIGVSAGLWAWSLGWTYFHTKHTVNTAVALAAAPAQR